LRTSSLSRSARARASADDAADLRCGEARDHEVEKGKRDHEPEDLTRERFRLQLRQARLCGLAARVGDGCRRLRSVLRFAFHHVTRLAVAALS